MKFTIINFIAINNLRDDSRVYQFFIKLLFFAEALKKFLNL